MSATNKSLIELVEESLMEKDATQYGIKIAALADQLQKNLSEGAIESTLIDVRDLQDKFNNPVFKQSILTQIHNNAKLYTDRTQTIQSLFEQYIAPKTHKSSEWVISELRLSAVQLASFAARTCGIVHADEVQALLDDQDYVSDLSAVYIRLYVRMKKTALFRPLSSDVMDNIEQSPDQFFKQTLQALHKKYLKKKNETTQNATHLSDAWVRGQVERQKDSITETVLGLASGTQRTLFESVFETEPFWSRVVSEYITDYTQSEEGIRTQMSSLQVHKNIDTFIRQSNSSLSKYIKKVTEIIKSIANTINPKNDESRIVPKNPAPTEDILDPIMTDKSYPCSPENYFSLHSGSGIQEQDLTYTIDRGKLRGLSVKDQAGRDLKEGIVTIDVASVPPQVKVNHSLLPADITELLITVPVRIKGTYQIPDLGAIAFNQEASFPFVVKFTGVNETRITQQLGEEETKESIRNHMKGWGYDEKHVQQLLSSSVLQTQLTDAYKKDDGRPNKPRTSGDFHQKLVQYAQSPGALKTLFDILKDKLGKIKEQFDTNHVGSGVYEVKPAAKPLSEMPIIPGGGERRIDLPIIGRAFQIAPTSAVGVTAARDDQTLKHLIQVTSLDGTLLDNTCWRIDSGTPPVLVIDQNSAKLPDLLSGVKIQLPIALDLTYTDPDYGNFTFEKKHTLQETIEFVGLHQSQIERQLQDVQVKKNLSEQMVKWGGYDPQYVDHIIGTTAFRDEVIVAYQADVAAFPSSTSATSFYDKLIYYAQQLGRMKELFDRVKKKLDAVKEQFDTNHVGSGVCEVKPAAKPLSEMPIIPGGGERRIDLPIIGRAFQIAPTSAVGVTAARDDQTLKHLIQVTSLDGTLLDNTCWRIDSGTPPVLVIDQNSAKLPDLLSGVKIQLPIALDLTYTDPDYGNFTFEKKHTLQETIKFTELDARLIARGLGSPDSRKVILDRLVQSGRTEDQVNKLILHGFFVAELISAFQIDYDAYLKTDPRDIDPIPVLLAKFIGQPSNKVGLLFESVKKIIIDFAESTDLNRNTSDLYKKPADQINRVLDDAITADTIPFDIDKHLFQRRPGKVPVSGVDMTYDFLLQDQVQCVDQTGKSLVGIPGLFRVRPSCEIELDHSKVPPGTTSLRFTFPVKVTGIFGTTTYGDFDFTKDTTLEQIIEFKGLPTRVFHQYFDDTVDKQLAMRMIQLHPEQLVDQCIDQSNGIFAGKLTGKLTRDDAELMEKCFTSEIRGLTCVSPHAHLNNTVTVIELLVYEALLQKSREVHDIKDVHALLQELHSDPKKLFDTLGILEKAYTIYQEFDANYMATRTPIPTGYGRLPEPRRSTVSRGLGGRFSRKFDDLMFESHISPNDYPSYAYLKGAGDEHGDIKEVEQQTLRGNGITYSDVKYMINIQHPGSIDFDLTIPEQGGRAEYVFNGSPGEVQDIRDQLESDFSYPPDAPDRKLQYTVQLLFEKELALRLSRQLGLLSATYGGNTYILEVEGTGDQEELVLRRRGTGVRALRETRRFRDLDTNNDRDDFVELIQEVMDNSVRQHRSLMLTNSTQTDTDADYLHACDHFPNYSTIESSMGGMLGMRWGKKLEIEEDTWTFGPDKITVSYKNGEFTLHDEHNTYKKTYKNMGELLLDTKTQSYALDFMTKFHEKYLEYMTQARQVDQKYTYLVRDPLSGYMIGIQNINGRLTFGYVAHETMGTFPGLQEVRGRASLYTEYDNDFLCNAPVSFNKNSEETAKRMIFGRRELYYPLLQAILKNSKGTSADVAYRYEQVKNTATTVGDVAKNTGKGLFDAFMDGRNSK